jgi:hypothetical protein
MYDCADAKEVQILGGEFTVQMQDPYGPSVIAALATLRIKASQPTSDLPTNFSAH